MFGDAIEVLGWTLLHFVWQGFVVGVFAAVLLAAIQRRSANARYLAGVVALSLMSVLPVVTFCWMREPPSPLTESPIIYWKVPTEVLDATSETGTTIVESIGIDFESPPPTNAIPIRLEPAPQIAETFGLDRVPWPSLLPWIVSGWLAGVVVLSLRLLAGWLSTQRLRRRSSQPASDHWQSLLRRLADRLRVTRPVRLVESALVEVPAVIGWLRPVILLPATAMTGLTAEQLEALLAHELAHVRRHDYLVNLLQTVVETLLFYHPAVWWLSHRIRVEREHCCDDLAASVCGDRLSYAKALVAMEELRAPPLGLAMSARGGSLLSRVTRLLGVADEPSRSIGWLAGLIALLTLTVAAALGAGLLTPPADTPTRAEQSKHATEEASVSVPTLNQETRPKSTPRADDKTTIATNADQEGWSDEQGGLRTRLSLVSEKPVVGELRIRLEVRSVSNREISWRLWDQDLTRFLQITDPDGKRSEDLMEHARLWAPSHPSVVVPTQVKPGQTIKLFDDFDLVPHFLLPKPGLYQIRFGRAADGEVAGKSQGDGEGITPIPESKTLTLTLGEGKLPEIQSLALRLRGVAPKGWSFSVLPEMPQGRPGVLLFPPNCRQTGEYLVVAFLGNEDKSRFLKIADKHIAVEDLGHTKLGHAFVAVMREAKAEWPNCVEHIRAQLPVAEKTDKANDQKDNLPNKNDADLRSDAAVETAERVIARVNGLTIREADVTARYFEQLGRLREQTTPDEFRKQVDALIRVDLPTVIQTKLLVAEAMKFFDAKQRQEAEEFIQRNLAEQVVAMMKDSGVTNREELQNWLRKRGTSLERVESEYKERLYAQQFLAKKLDPTKTPEETEKLRNQLLLQLWQQAEVKSEYLPHRGEIRWVDRPNERVWINLGEADGVKRGSTYRVVSIPPNNAPAQPIVIKGKIEVIRLIDAHTSEARILESDNDGPAKGNEVIPADFPNPKANGVDLRLLFPFRKPDEDKGRFVGRVRLKIDGEKPLPDLEKVEVPAGKVLDESLVFSKEGGLANVFVYLWKPTFKIEPATEAELAKPFVLVVKNRKFQPHAALVRVGRPVVFENGVAEPMNFVTQPLRNTPFNVLVKPEDRFKVPAFEKSESFPFAIKNNIKPWMLAHLLPLDHPFAALTDDDGRFEINGLPPGEHEFRVWHERVGWLEKSLKITIQPGEDAKSELGYAPDRLKLTEADVRSWGDRLIDAKWVPRAIVP